ncbi:solute carrier organic anion transporter family member 4C1-like [Sarcophilus harrisii]
MFYLPFIGIRTKKALSQVKTSYKTGKYRQGLQVVVIKCCIDKEGSPYRQQLFQGVASSQNHVVGAKTHVVHSQLIGIVVNGLVNISISTIEKRYQLSSFMTGLVSSSYDISFCLLSLFISFYGERGHKPRWLAFASFMMGLGSLVFTLPHFISGKYELASEYKDTCPQTRIPNFCQRNITSSLSIYLYVFILGQMMLGVGGTPLYTLGTAFIDDSVPTHLSSLYIGIGYAMSVLGPAIGYVLGGQLLTIYIDSDMNGK